MFNNSTPIHDHSNMFCGDCGRFLEASNPEETMILPHDTSPSSPEFEMVVYRVFRGINSETSERTELRVPVYTKRLHTC